MKYKTSYFTLFASILGILMAPSRSHAQCVDPPGAMGQVFYNGDTNAPQYCNGSDWIALGVVNPSAGGSGCTNPAATEGRIIYNGDEHVPQYCDGDDWRAMIGYIDREVSGCIPNPLCPNIGDVCDDGNAGTTNDPLFAGFVAFNDPNSADAGKCEAIYVTNNNQSTLVEWKISTGTDDIATDSKEDGKINDGQVVSSSTFPAFELCKNLTDGGFSDWYLPAQVELNVLYENRAAIDANAAGAFSVANYYWSSTEYDTSSAIAEFFGDGVQLFNAKTSALSARCVRRD